MMNRNMRTSMILPDKLLDRVMDLSRARTKTEAVILSLETFVRLKLRQRIAAAAGTLRSLPDPEDVVRGRRKR